MAQGIFPLWLLHLSDRDPLVNLGILRLGYVSSKLNFPDIIYYSRLEEWADARSKSTCSTFISIQYQYEAVLILILNIE